jgi:uncharacterized protein (TIGR03000 family)
MRFALLVVSALLFDARFVTALDRTPTPSAMQATAPAQAVQQITVIVPHEQTELTVDGTVIDGTGTFRTFDTPQFGAAGSRTYTFIATWQPNTYTRMTRQKTVTLRAGDRLTVDLTVDDPNDRVKVQYVPTPDHVAEAMVTLAGVTASDIVFEPGCGDARITIAAVKGGARKGVGIDIDAERVADSQAKVKEAGLADKIDIRLGDALDIKDLSDANVVFLYMGDHFNMLIRPILWRDLKVGSRIVSHRFTMGDWQPDKTVTVSTFEGEEYQLHLWIITDEIKRRAAANGAVPVGDLAGQLLSSPRTPVR